MNSKDFLSISDLTSESIRALVNRAVTMKEEGFLRAD